MKNIVLTTLFAGCFAISSAAAEECAFKAGTFDFGAKLAAGMSFAKADNKTLNTKKSSALCGIAFAMRYNVTDCFGIGGELFADSFRYQKSGTIKLTTPEQLEKLTGSKINNIESVENKTTHKVKGRFGALITFSYAPLENMSFLFGVGIVRNRDLKLTQKTSIQPNSGKTVTLNKDQKQKMKIAPIFKLGADYHFNKNWSLGVEGTYSQAKFKDAEDLKFRNATIAATVKYTF